jgi:DNA-binding NarL/FixJ family response regulator
MMETVSIQVLAPAVLRRGLEAVLAALADVRVVPSDAEVTLVYGSGWESRLAGVQHTGAGEGPGALVLMTGGEAEELARAGRLGVEVFVSPEDPEPVLEQAFRAAARAEPYCSPALTGCLVRALSGRYESNERRVDELERRIAALTNGELRVAICIAEGCTNAQAAERLFVSINTIKDHLDKVYRKLGRPGRVRLSHCLAALRKAQAERESRGPLRTGD